MNEEIKMKLSEAGMDVDDALGRFMNSEPMLIKFLKKFMEDTSYGELIKAVGQGDNEKAFRASHTLKGVAANFSFVELKAKASDACEAFRMGDFLSGVAMVPAVSDSYEKIMNVLTSLYSE